MFSSLKRTACFLIVISVLNIIASLFLFIFAQSITKDYVFIFFAAAYLLTSALALILISCGLLTLSNDLDYQNNYLIKKTSELSKRVETLENKD